VPNFSEQNLTKLYYTIGEVASMFEVNTSLIRFWEKEFSSINPKKTNSGKRLYTPKDITIIADIYTKVKVNGFTLDGAKKSLAKKPLIKEHKLDSSEIIDRLIAIKSQLLRLKSN